MEEDKAGEHAPRSARGGGSVSTAHGRPGRGQSCIWDTGPMSRSSVWWTREFRRGGKGRQGGWGPPALRAAWATCSAAEYW